MGFQSISRLNAPPFVQNAYSQGVIKENAFGFKLTDGASELFIGGDNPSLHSGSFEKHTVTQAKYCQRAAPSRGLMLSVNPDLPSTQGPSGTEQ